MVGTIEEEQVTQMETIAGRVSLGKAMGRTIARRLSRARTRSRDILAVPNGLVIGVSVEEATVEAEHADGDDGTGLGPGTPTAFVFAQADVVANGGREGGGTRSRRSTVSMPNPMVVGRTPTPTSVQTLDKEKDSIKEKDRRAVATSSWVAKALDLTRRLKRRSMAVLPQSTLNSAP